MQETPVWLLGQENQLRRDRLPTWVFLGFVCASAGKEFACDAGDLGLIPELGRSPGEGKGYPLQYSCLKNSMDWIVLGVAKSQTWPSDFHFHIERRRADVEAEASIFWSPDANCWLIGKDPDAGKDWRQEEKGMTGWVGSTLRLYGLEPTRLLQP